MHYHNGISAARRIGISYKTLLRYIEKGRIVPEEDKTLTGQLVISEDQVESLRIEVQRERDMFKRPHAGMPGSRQHETPMDTQEIPLTDTTLNEALKELGKLQARVDVQDARIAELERRATELEQRQIQPATESPRESPSMSQTVSAPPGPVPADLPPGTLHSIDFAEQLGLKRSVFDSMMKNGIGGEELERTKIPIPARPGQNKNYFTPQEQQKAIELLRKHKRIQ